MFNTVILVPNLTRKYFFNYPSSGQGLPRNTTILYTEPLGPSPKDMRSDFRLSRYRFLGRPRRCRSVGR